MLGSLRPREWVDKAGVKHHTTDVHVARFELLGKPPESESLPVSADDGAPAPGPEDAPPGADEEIPF